MMKGIIFFVTRSNLSLEGYLPLSLGYMHDCIKLRNLKTFTTFRKQLDQLNLGMYSIWDFQVCSNDDPRMTFDLLKGTIKFVA